MSTGGENGSDGSGGVSQDGGATLWDAVRRAGRTNNLDAARAVAAVACVAIHALGPAYDPVRRVSPAHRLGLQDLALPVFFALSGLLLTFSWRQRPDVRDWSRKRAARLVPGYLLAVALALALAPFAAPGALDAYAWQDLALAALTVEPLRHPDVFAGLPTVMGSLNQPVHTLRIEASCYVILAGLGLIGALRPGRRWATVLVAALFAGALALAEAQARSGAGVGVGIGTLGLPLWTGCLSMFLGGMLLALGARRLPLSGPLAAAAALALAAAFLLQPARQTLHLAMPLTVPYLLAYVGYGLRPVTAGFVDRFGDLSYFTYLGHWPVIGVLGMLLGPAAPAPLVFALTLIVTLPLAALSWRFVERPWLDRLRGGRPDQKPAQNPSEKTLRPAIGTVPPPTPAS